MWALNNVGGSPKLHFGSKSLFCHKQNNDLEPKCNFGDPPAVFYITVVFVHAAPMAPLRQSLVVMKPPEWRA